MSPGGRQPRSARQTRSEPGRCLSFRVREFALGAREGIKELPVLGIPIGIGSVRVRPHPVEQVVQMSVLLLLGAELLRFPGPRTAMGQAGFHTGVEEDQFLAQGQDGPNDVGIAAFDDPAGVAGDELLDIFQARLQGSPLRGVVIRHRIQREQGNRMMRGELFGEGGFTRAGISQQDQFHRMRQRTEEKSYASEGDDLREKQLTDRKRTNPGITTPNKKEAQREQHDSTKGICK